MSLRLQHPSLPIVLMVRFVPRTSGGMLHSAEKPMTGGIKRRPKCVPPKKIFAPREGEDGEGSIRRRAKTEGGAWRRGERGSRRRPKCVPPNFFGVSLTATDGRPRAWRGRRSISLLWLGGSGHLKLVSYNNPNIRGYSSGGSRGLHQSSGGCT